MESEEFKTLYDCYCKQYSDGKARALANLELEHKAAHKAREAKFSENCPIVKHLNDLRAMPDLCANRAGTWQMEQLVEQVASGAKSTFPPAILKHIKALSGEVAAYQTAEERYYNRVEIIRKQLREHLMPNESKISEQFRTQRQAIINDPNL